MNFMSRPRLLLRENCRLSRLGSTRELRKRAVVEAQEISIRARHSTAGNNRESAAD
jgi:hypothetical protein